MRALCAGIETYLCDYGVTAMCSDPVGDWTSGGVV